MIRAQGFARQAPAATTAVNASILVNISGTQTPATIYADNNLTAKSNPFNADSNGYWFFYATSGRYDVVISPGVSQPSFTPYTQGDVDLTGFFSLNGLTNETLTLVANPGAGTTDFTISTSGGNTINFNFPDASATARGLVNTGAQTFNGLKTFNTPIAAGSGGTGLSTAPTNGQLLIGSTGVGYVLAGLTGTANQVTVTPAAGSITLATPQNIHTGATPTFAGLTLSAASPLTASGLSANSVLSLGGTSQLVATALTNGQLLIGSTGAAPVAATLTAGTGISITNAAGSITINATGTGVTSLAALTGALSLVVGSAGTAFNIATGGSTITLNLPDASATADGTVNTTTQSFAGLKTFLTSPQYNPGTSSSTVATLNGVISAQVSSAGVGNSGAGETVLFSFVLPANALSASGKGVRITAFGTLANNATAKTGKLYFGATSPTFTFAVSAAGLSWKAILEVYYVTGVTQVGQMTCQSGNTTGSNATVCQANVAPGETLSGAVTLKATATGGANNDIVCNGMIVEMLGA